MSEPARKKRKTNSFFNVSQFAATEADEGGDDDSDWGEEMDEDIPEAELERHRKEVHERYKRTHAPSLNSNIPNRHNNHESQLNILERLERKYASGHSYTGSVIDNESIIESQHATMADSFYRSSIGHPARVEGSVEGHLPGVQDPNLWLVPCLPGKERYAVQELLKKYFKYLNHASKKLFIKTAFTTDMNTGYIYVEAFKEIHVRRACEDISGLNTWKLRLVPRNEMVDALTIKAAGPQIKRGQWCRFQRGIYKGDLAQVYAILDQGSKVVLRVVPRIDYGKLSIMNAQNNNNGRGGRNGNPAFMRRGRPPQKLFSRADIELYEDHNKAPESILKDTILQTKIVRWRGKKYKNGCHLVTVPVNQVEFDVTAAPEEVQLLRSKTGDDDWEDDGDDELDEVAPPIIQKTCEFVRGDTVKVIRGAMTNLIGEVLTTQPNAVSGGITVTVLPQHRSLVEAIMFPSDELMKYFSVGCHVKVKSGKFKDETGLIISVGDDDNNESESSNEVIIFSDLTSRTIRVDINDITETSEVSTGRDVLGNYALYELVHLSRDVVGVIVSIQNGTFQILDNKDQIQTCRLPDIARHSHDTHAVALDIDNNQIRIGDVIIPQVGDFKQQRATVKHVYRSVLFCHMKSCTVNSGIFVVRSRLCRLAGSKLRANVSVSQQMNGSSRDTKNDRRLRILHKHRNSRDPWMHKTVKVKRGSYKGMIGIVCGCTDSKLNIELHAKCKKIQVKREDVKVINQDGSDIDDNPYSNMGMRPIQNGNRGMSNGFGDRGNGYQRRGGNNYGNNRGRMHAAETPLVGAHTPAYGRGDSSDNAQNIGAQTPAMGGQTPAYGGVTPAYTENSHSMGSNGNVHPERQQRNNAWNVGGMTPAHSNGLGMGMGAQTPVSPPYSGSYSTNDNVHTPSYGHGGSVHSHGTMGSSHISGLSESQNSESESSNDIDKAMASDPFYFIIDNALLTYNGQSCVVKNVDKTNGVCAIAHPQSHDIFQTSVPLGHIQHTVPSDLSNAKVKVVFGKLCGEVGMLIGIDNEEAVVQLSATTEVTIIAKKLVVVYCEP